MKFRTDFVTNSSSTSYIAFHVKNKALAEFFKKIGITSLRVGDFGDATNLTDNAEIFDPNTGAFDFIGEVEEGLGYIPEDITSVTPWLIFTLLELLGDEGREEFIAKWNQAKNIHNLGDWEEALDGNFAEYFGAMDGSISEASIENKASPNYSLYCDFTEIVNGQMFKGKFFEEDEKPKAKKNLTFVVTGKLSRFGSSDEFVKAVKQIGCKVSDSVSDKTDYLVCDDLNSTSAEMKTAVELGVPILTETAFIRRFLNAKKFKGLQDKDNLVLKAFDIEAKLGGYKEFIIDNGLSVIETEVWQDGKWVKKRS